MKIIKTIEKLKEFIEINELAFVYISSPSCNVCEALLPKVKEILKKYPKIQIAFVEADDVPEIASEFSIFTIPVLIFYINGIETIRQARFVSILELDQKINRYYSMLE